MLWPKRKQKKEWELPESEATTESVFQARRRLVKALGLGAIGGAMGSIGLHYATRARLSETARYDLLPTHPDFENAGRNLTNEDTVYRFTNFYEFAFDKSSPARLCRNFKIEPWQLQIDGLVRKPKVFDLDDIEKMRLEQRVYRFRCVEAWAMTLPWVGLPLNRLLEKVEPLPSAKFVLLTSFMDPKQAPRQSEDSSPWPYREAVRLNEAMNPLAFVATGLYGKKLQPQNGAPLRIVFPWKYGFKGPKSVVKITLVDQRPATFWNTLQPQEYGFFGNVNPDKPHPRWSQKQEAIVGSWGRRVATEKFNGYGRWVSDLYQ